MNISETVTLEVSPTQLRTILICNYGQSSNLTLDVSYTPLQTKLNTWQFERGLYDHVPSVIRKKIKERTELLKSALQTNLNTSVVVFLQAKREKQSKIGLILWQPPLWLLVAVCSTGLLQRSTAPSMSKCQLQHGWLNSAQSPLSECRNSHIWIWFWIMYWSLAPLSVWGKGLKMEGTTRENESVVQM